MISPDGRVHAHVESCYHGQASATGCEMYETYTYARDTRGFMAKASSDPPSFWSFTLHARRRSWPWRPCLWLCTLAVGVKDEKSLCPLVQTLWSTPSCSHICLLMLCCRVPAAATMTRTDDTEDAAAVARRPNEDVRVRLCCTTHRRVHHSRRRLTDPRAGRRYVVRTWQWPPASVASLRS